MFLLFLLLFFFHAFTVNRCFIPPQIYHSTPVITVSVPAFLTFVGELGHAVQISQSRGSVLLFVIDQQIHLRLRQELSHSPSTPAGSFLGRRRQRLAVFVFVLHDRREDGCRPGETSLHGVVHSVKPGPGAWVCLHTSSRKLQLLVETENIFFLSKLPTATDS